MFASERKFLTQFSSIKSFFRSFFLIFAVVFLLSPLAVDGEEIIIGMGDDWEKLLPSSFEEVKLVRGKKGFLDLVLEDGAYTVDENTDFLFHAEQYPYRDQTGNYLKQGPEGSIRIDEYPGSSALARIGSGAAVYRGEGGTPFFASSDNTMFSPGSSWGDFSIEFWLYPVVLEEGESIFRWNGSIIHQDRPREQSIQCSVYQRKLSWRFINLFMPPDQGAFNLELTAKKSLIPRKWSHHLIRFRAETGIIEYCINGIPEDIAFANSSNRETGEVYFPHIGEGSDEGFYLANDFTGMIDEVRITRDFIEDPFIDEYRDRPGTAILKALDLGHKNSHIMSIEADYSRPATTEILFYYRTADEIRFSRNMEDGWKSFIPTEAFPENVRGRYLQLKAVLYPSGDLQRSPSLSHFRIIYEPDLPPSPPARIIARPGNGKVRLEWTEVPEADVEGYYVYYGDAPSRYFGSDSDLGSSPIDVGNTTSVDIDGLLNGKLYYFTVAAYDKAVLSHELKFSQEVSARPRGVYE